MNTKNPLITGTLILTGAGLITRVIGFFNRIYLSKLIGAEEMGIYQMVFPIYMIAFSLSCHGIELALSQLTARYYGKRRTAFIRPLIFTAASFSMLLSAILSFLIFEFSDAFSHYLLHEKRCALCLKLIAPVLPFTALRSCLHGYYIGLKKTGVPAIGQLFEQVTRIGAIFLVSSYYKEPHFSAVLAVIGMITGELCSTAFTFLCYQIRGKNLIEKTRIPFSSYGLLAGKLFNTAIPLSSNKLALTLFSSVETILIPLMLTNYYQNKSLAISLYGVLTGMVLPFIMFPSTITNSLSVMLLPEISEANAAQNKKQMLHTIEKAVKLSLSLGFTALVFFFFFGKDLGTFIFKNESAGDFLFMLAFLCPFLYLSSTNASILNGLGKMKQTFLYSIIGLLIRILTILFFIPVMGMRGYLLGLLAAHLTVVFLQMRKMASLLK